MEFIGNAKIVEKLPKIGDAHEFAQMHGRAIKIEHVKTEGNYKIYCIWYRNPEYDCFAENADDMSEAAPFSFAVKNTFKAKHVTHILQTVQTTTK